MRRRAGFTLIELLIVVAMIGLLTSAFFTVTVFSMRAGAEEQIRSTLRQEGLLVIRSFLRDAHLSRSLGQSAGEVQANPDTIILEYGGADSDVERRVAYRRKGPRVERLVWNDSAATPTVQTLAGHVRRWKIGRKGGLVRLEIELGTNRYTKDFVQEYAVTTRVGARGEG